MKNNYQIKAVLSITLSVMLCILFMSPVSAKGHDMKKMWSHEKLAKKLDLNESQKEKVKSLFESHKNEVKNHKEKLDPLQEKKKKLKESDPINHSEFRATLESINKIEVDMKMAHIRFHDKVNSLLSDQQKKKFKELKHKRHKRAKHHRQHQRHRDQEH